MRDLDDAQYSMLIIQPGNGFFSGDNYPSSPLDDELDNDIAPQPLSLTVAEHSFAGWEFGTAPPIQSAIFLVGAF